MFRFRFVRWLIHAYRDVAHVLRSIADPWLDVAAVKTTQTDLVNAFSGLQADIAGALTSINEVKRELARLDSRIAEQNAAIRDLSARLDTTNCKDPETAAAPSE